MRAEKIPTALLLAAGLLAAGAARAQEPPPFPGGADAQQAPADAPAIDANTNDPAMAASNDYFHEQLAPYGQWVNHNGNDEVWVPKVEPGWRPYTAGHWAYTDQGWAWVADEPWGWAAFHYGRWDYDQQLGWAWSPGTVWSPAWVAWRQGGGYLGWAPLSSADGFSAERGVLGAQAITAGFFTFVAEQNILHPNIGTVIVPSARNAAIVSGTTNITSYRMVNHRVINSGVDVHRIERITGHPVTPVRVAALAQAGPHGRGAFYQPAVVTRAGATRAEFGQARQQRTTQQGIRTQRTTPSYPSPRHGTTPATTQTPSRTPGYSTNPAAHPPYQSPTHYPPNPTMTPAQPQNPQKAVPQKPAEKDKTKQKPPV
jgi:hypothetical protein